jgi:hypothetical protein
LLGLHAVYALARKNILSQPQRDLIARLAGARSARDRRRYFASKAQAAQSVAPVRPPEPDPPPKPPPRSDSAAALAAQAEIRSLFED